ncbi:MAG TPA: rhomboid family intramembrane serine protease [Geminicoccaceae bacterium]|jgi:membrane associated rhomboid family serine protease|nr:rhomboid family intramembrane serine protease [Geminicoccaceae bacterium]
MAFRPSVPSGSNARPPAINLPPLTLALLAAMTIIHVGLALAPAEFERLGVMYFSFIPAAYLAEGWPFWSLLVAPFSYALLHGGFGHLVLNGVMLAVMGQVLERRLGPGGFLLLFAAGAAGGALVHFMIGGAPRVPLIGASAGVGGLYGAGLVLHRRGVYLGPNTRLLVVLAGLFIIMNLLGLVLPILSDIAYAAHLGGFIAGALVAARLTPARRV